MVSEQESTPRPEGESQRGTREPTRHRTAASSTNYHKQEPPSQARRQARGPRARSENTSQTILQITLLGQNSEQASLDF